MSDAGGRPAGRPTIEVGVSLASNHRVDDVRVGARIMVERAAAAAAAGLASLTVGDHHVNHSPYYQNVPIMGRLLAEWDDRPAGCLFLLPLWHPVLLAEQVGTLAAIAGGPFILQTGLGYGDDVFAAMGADARRRAAAFEEAAPVVRTLLDGGTASSERLGIRTARIAPAAPGRVEWWIGGGASRALDRAARLGDVWYANADLTLADARAQFDRYREACARHGRTPRATIRRDVLVAETDAEAEALARPLLDAGYRGFPPEAVVHGSPATVAEAFAAYADLGFEQVVTRSITVPQEAALISIAGLGEVRRLLGA